MKDNIKNDYYWNTTGVLLQNATSPLLIVAITHINGIGDSGVFSFAFSLSIIFWVIGMWGGRTYQVSDVKNEFSHRSYIMVRLLLAGVIFVGAGLFAVINNYNSNKTAIILTLVAFKAVESIADSLHGVMQVHDRLYIVGKSLAYKAIFGFIAFLAIDITTKSVLLGCIGIFVVNVLVLVFYDLRITNKLENIDISTNKIKQQLNAALAIMRRCSPVFAVLFFDMFALNIPRYYIDRYHPNQVGYYGIIAMPLTLVVMVVSFILQPKIVGLSELYSQQKYPQFNAIVKQLCWLTILIGVAALAGTVIIGVPALHIIFGIDFDMYRSSLNMIVFGGIANALVALLLNMLVVMRVLRRQVYILVFTNILLVIFSRLLVPSHALFGAVTLFTVTSIIQALLFAWLYQSTLGRRNNG